MTYLPPSGDRGPVVGNAAAGLGGLLASLGIVAAVTRDSVEDTVAAELVRRGLDAHVLELRWGHLVLGAGPQQAQLLRFDVDALSAVLDEVHPNAVTQVSVRVVLT